MQMSQAPTPQLYGCPIHQHLNNTDVLNSNTSTTQMSYTPTPQLYSCLKLQHLNHTDVLYANAKYSHVLRTNHTTYTCTPSTLPPLSKACNKTNCLCTSPLKRPPEFSEPVTVSRTVCPYRGPGSQLARTTTAPTCGDTLARHAIYASMSLLRDAGWHCVYAQDNVMVPPRSSSSSDALTLSLSPQLSSHQGRLAIFM